MASYVVRSGDSLSIIAREVLGNLSRWPELADLNAIAAPYTIYPGQVLQLPGGVAPADPAGGRNVIAAPGAVSQSPWYKNKWVWFGLAALLALAGATSKRRG